MTRSYGNGTCFQDKKTGQWIVRLSFKDPGTGKRIRPAFTGATKTEAKEKARRYQLEVKGGAPIPSGSLRLGPFLDKWLDEVIRTSGVSLNTFDNYESIIRNHIKPALGTKKLRDLSPDDIQALITAKLDAGYGHATVMRIRTTLVKALRHGERFGHVGRNVAALVDLPRAPRRQGRSLTVEQAKALLEAARGERLEAAIACGLMMGLRPGEVLGLRWADLDLEEEVLTVNHSLIRERNKLRLGDTKTPSSVRALKIPREVLDALRRHKALQAKERLAAGEAWIALDLVFATEIGTLTDPSNLRRVLHRLCEKAGIGQWSPNELRHSFASLLSHSGVPLDRVADAMGHVDTRMTSAVYRHRLMPVVNEAAAPMEEIFATRAVQGS